MQKDYSVTIFSRARGKTRTFNLDRRFFYLPLTVLIILVVSCILFGQAYFQEREERQRLEDRIALLEQLTNESEERSENQGGGSLSKESADPVEQPPVNVALIREEKGTNSETQAAQAQIGDQTASEPQRIAVAKIDDAKATSLEEDIEGFKFTFKLVNLIGDSLAGNVAIIASLKPPHKPRYVSFPSMRLVDGMPVKLRKSVGFSIRYFRYVTGRFYFPFSYSESFRILIYDQDEELILDSTVLAEDVDVNEFLHEELDSSSETS